MRKMDIHKRETTTYGISEQAMLEQAARLARQEEREDRMLNGCIYVFVGILLTVSLAVYVAWVSLAIQLSK